MLIREVRYSFLMRVTTHEVCECTEGRLCYFRNRCLNSMSSCNPLQLILGRLIFFFLVQLFERFAMWEEEELDSRPACFCLTRQLKAFQFHITFATWNLTWFPPSQEIAAKQLVVIYFQKIMYSELWLKENVPKKVLGENDQRADSEPDPRPYSLYNGSMSTLKIIAQCNPKLR